MKTQKFQDKLDVFIEKLFLWMIPESLKPNHFTVLRLLFVPLVFYTLSAKLYVLAAFLFVLAASTDFIDGTLARKRNQITEIGKILDPIADKLLIATVLYVVGFEYLIVKIFLFFILLEITGISAMFLFSVKKFGRVIPANVFGKIKMVLQSLSVALFLVGIILNNIAVIKTSEIILFVAFGFAVLASVLQVKLEYDEVFKHKLKKTSKN